MLFTNLSFQSAVRLPPRNFQPSLLLPVLLKYFEFEYESNYITLKLLSIPQHPSTPLDVVVHDGVVAPLARAELPAVAARRRPLTCPEGWEMSDPSQENTILQKNS